MFVQIWRSAMNCKGVRLHCTCYKVLSKYLHLDDPVKFKLQLLVFVLFGALFITITYQIPKGVVVRRNGGACILPELDPFDKTIMAFYQTDPGQIKCGNVSFIPLFGNDGRLLISGNVSQLYDLYDLKCNYSEIHRVDDFFVEYSAMQLYTSPDAIPTDSFVIECYDSNNTVLYQNVHNKITPMIESETEPETDDEMSIIIFGIDSLSRLGAFRTLPRTVNYLQNKLNAYIFKGFNKVGDNTFPNLIPMLTGSFVEEWPDISPSFNFAGDYPLIWKNFSEAKYVTFLGEDRPDINIFSHAMPFGFGEKPTHHYLREGFLATSDITPIALGNVSKGVYEPIITEKNYMCYGDRAKHRILLDYHRDFLKTYKGKKKFSMAWTSQLGHADMNHFQLGDKDYEDFFRFIHEGGYLKRTILIFMGDHGPRFSNVRNTFMGRIEDHMPLLAIVVPEHIKTKYPHIHRNLHLNTEKISSHFDTYQLLADILHKSFRHDSIPAPHGHGVSFFRSFPNSRSCEHASIPEEFCACYSSTLVDTSRSEVNGAARAVVDHVNKLLSNHSQCAMLKLQNIMSASLLESKLKPQHKEENAQNESASDCTTEELNENYLATIETYPGKATFEATVKHDIKLNLYNIKGSIFRTNRFGNSSWCVKDQLLKPYCYCL